MSYRAKRNYKNMYKNTLQCSRGCLAKEYQSIFLKKKIPSQREVEPKRNIQDICNHCRLVKADSSSG